MSEELNNMQEFALPEQNTVKIENVIDPLEDLVNHDFASNTEINLEESYEMLSILERESKLAKTLEAENVIEEIATKYIDEEYKSKIDKGFENVKAFIRKYNIELDEVKNLTDKEKDKLFAIGSFLNKNLGTTLNDLMFSITVTREEYKFIATAVERKLEYDGNEVFNIIELNERYLKEWKELDKMLPKQVPTMVINIDIKNVVMLYHFLGKHKVKGLDREFYVFASVLQKIADTNRLYNAYNVMKERLNIDFNIWVGALEPDVDLVEQEQEN